MLPVCESKKQSSSCSAACAGVTTPLLTCLTSDGETSATAESLWNLVSIGGGRTREQEARGEGRGGEGRGGEGRGGEGRREGRGREGRREGKGGEGRGGDGRGGEGRGGERTGGRNSFPFTLN